MGTENSHISHVSMYDDLCYYASWSKVWKHNGILDQYIVEWASALGV